MANRINTIIKSTAGRHYVRIVALVVLAFSLGVLLYDSVNHVSRPLETRDLQIPENTVTQSIHSEETVSPVILDAAEPTYIRIPSVGIEADFENPLGLHPDQTVEVPESYDQVGWYKHGPTPGELGPAVVLGHVDSYQGPAVFFRIGQLEKGDTIEITRDDGSLAIFSVTGIARYEQEGFPSALVYGDIGHAGLRLVTCSGTFDRGEQRYSHNTVVYAELLEPEGTNIGE